MQAKRILAIASQLATKATSLPAAPQVVVAREVTGRSALLAMEGETMVVENAAEETGTIEGAATAGNVAARPARIRLIRRNSPRRRRLLLLHRGKLRRRQKSRCRWTTT
jgi:hypothetical protein